MDFWFESHTNSKRSRPLSGYRTTNAGRIFILFIGFFFFIVYYPTPGNSGARHNVDAVYCLPFIYICCLSESYSIITTLAAVNPKLLFTTGKNRRETDSTDRYGVTKRTQYLYRKIIPQHWFSEITLAHTPCVLWPCCAYMCSSIFRKPITTLIFY